MCNVGRVGVFSAGLLSYSDRTTHDDDAKSNKVHKRRAQRLVYPSLLSSWSYILLNEGPFSPFTQKTTNNNNKLYTHSML